jgi:hypothetical protein
MDCKTARLLLDFVRPHAPEVDPTDAAELDRHLSGCPACAGLAAEERRLDDVLGRAMRRVEVPAGLAQQLHNRLEADRTERSRRWWGHGLRAAVAAALLVGLVWGGWLVWKQRPPRLLDPEYDGFVEDVKADGYQGHSSDTVDLFYRRNGIDAGAPTHLDYRYLKGYGLADFRGRQVPHLVFVLPGPEKTAADRKKEEGVPEPGAYVQVYILSGKKFDLDKLKDGAQANYGDFKVTVEIQQHASGRYAYVYVYNGDSLDRLRIARS